MFRNLKHKVRASCEKLTEEKYTVIYYYPLAQCGGNCDYCYQLIDGDLNKPYQDINQDVVINEYMRQLSKLDYNFVFGMLGGEPFHTKKQFQHNLDFYKRYKDDGFFIWYSHLNWDLEFIKEKVQILKEVKDFNNLIFHCTLHLFQFRDKEDGVQLFIDNILYLKENGYPYEINLLFDPRQIPLFQEAIKLIQEHDLKYYITFKDNDPSLGVQYFDLDIPYRNFHCSHLFVTPSHVQMCDTKLTENYKLEIFQTIKKKNKFCDNYNNCENKLGEYTVRMT